MIDSQFLNYTPHTIVLYSDDGPEKVFPPSGKILRLAKQPQRPLPFQHLQIPVFSRRVYVDVVGLNDVPRGASILVSARVGEKLATIPDKVNCWVFGPDIGPDAALCDGTGRICGTTRFVLYAVPSDTKYECPICGQRDMPIGCCLQCGTDLTEECCSIPATSLHIVDCKLVRRLIVDQSDSATFAFENK